MPSSSAVSTKSLKSSVKPPEAVAAKVETKTASQVAPAPPPSPKPRQDSKPNTEDGSRASRSSRSSAKSSSLTDRPVARSLRPEVEKQEEDSKSGASPWWIGVAALLVGGALWVGLGERSEKSAAVSTIEPQVQAARDEEPAPAVPEVAEPAPEPQAMDSEEVADEAPAPVVRRRVHSAKAKPLEEPEPAVEEPPRGPFDKAAANGALDGAAQQASACRQEGDPTGVARVVVTFAPSGRVTAATISGPPFAGTKTGSCIAKTMRGMSLSPFEGEFVTISKTVVIM